MLLRQHMPNRCRPTDTAASTNPDIVTCELAFEGSRIHSRGSSCPNWEELCRSNRQGGLTCLASYADHVAPSSKCRIAVSQPKLASKFGASMLPGASDSVTCFLKNGSGASTASYLVPAVRLTTTAYQRLRTLSLLQKKICCSCQFRNRF